MLKGVTASELLHTLEQIPLSMGAEFIIRELKQREHFLIIISAGYTLTTGHLKEKLDCNWAIANEFPIVDGKTTGEVEASLNLSDRGSNRLKYIYSVCKLNSLIEIS